MIWGAEEKLKRKLTASMNFFSREGSSKFFPPGEGKSIFLNNLCWFGGIIEHDFFSKRRASEIFFSTSYTPDHGWESP